jgi:hypothetical protein
MGVDWSLFFFSLCLVVCVCGIAGLILSCHFLVSVSLLQIIMVQQYTHTQWFGSHDGTKWWYVWIHKSTYQKERRSESSRGVVYYYCIHDIHGMVALSLSVVGCILSLGRLWLSRPIIRLLYCVFF